MFKGDEAGATVGRWTADEARAVLARWRASGLTKTAFTERHGLTMERLRRWERRLAEAEDAGEAELRLVPLVARQLVGVPERAAARLQLPGGVVLEFDATRVDPRWVAALVLEVARGA
jgi:hypothetical protein